jgi:nucleoside-diphosphate-sugar epimerase
MTDEASPSRTGAGAARRAQHALVTGWPGFVARPLVRRLLAEQPRGRVTCLVEDARRGAAEAALAALPSRDRKRVRLAYGDVRKMDLGLAGLEIDALADVTHVFHLAGIQSSQADARLLQAVNVDGVRNTLSLARELPALQRFVHFSSCFVAGDREGVILEEELDDVPANRSPYEDSKMRGEQLARAAMADLPVTVVRPSIVVGDSATGEIDRFDGVYAMGILVVTSPIGVALPLPGPGLGPLHVVPVDYLTRAVVHLANDPRAAGGTFHVVDPNPLSARMVYSLVARQAGKKVPAARKARKPSLASSLASSLALSVAARRASAVASSLAGSVAGSLAQTFPGAGLDRVKRSVPAVEMFDRFVVFNAAHTAQLLAGTDIVCPRFDTYVDALVRFVRDSLREERQAAAPVVPDPFG